MKKILFSSDIHGNLYQYEELVEAAFKNDASTIIIGGDLSYKSGKIYFSRPSDEEIKKFIGVDKLLKSPKHRRDYFDKFIFPILSKFLEISKENKIILCFGNADYFRNLEYYKKFHPQIEVIYADIVPLTQEFDLLIYSPVNLSPHRLKDNERFEWMKNEKYASEDYTIGIVSYSEKKIEAMGMKKTNKLKDLDRYGSSITQVALPKNEPKFSIEYEFRNLVKKMNPSKKSVWVCHAPPYDTNDVIMGSSTYVNVGSKCIRKFVEKYQPVAVLSGHIHESFFLLNGKYVENIGESKCFGSSNSPSSYFLHSLLLEIDGENMNISFIESKYEDKILSNISDKFKKIEPQKKIKN